MLRGMGLIFGCILLFLAAQGTLIYLCICRLSSHWGLALIYSMINGIISAALSHSGCKKSLHDGETNAAYFSAQSKSLLLKTTIFNSLANGIIPSNGALNFFGDKQIQSHEPLNGCAPDVSIFVFKPAACNSFVNSVRS